MSKLYKLLDSKGRVLIPRGAVRKPNGIRRYSGTELVDGKVQVPRWSYSEAGDQSTVVRKPMSALSCH